MRLCAFAFISLTMVSCGGRAGQAPPHGLAVPEPGVRIAQYGPPIPPGVLVGPIRLPHLSRTLRRTWPHILSAAVSRDGKHVALYTGSRVYLTNAQGQKARRLRVLLPEEIVNQETLVSFTFRPDNRRVAIMTTVIGGEPIGFTIERLWTAGVASGHLRQLRKWEYRVQGPDPVTADRKIAGWTKDNKAVIITGTIYRGEDMPSDARAAGVQRVRVNDAPISRRRR